MVDSGNNMTEEQNKATLPAEVVATETEEGTEPQGVDTEELEFVVEVEADQHDETAKKGEPDFKVAMKAERAKKKAEREAREKAEREVAELREQLEQQARLLAEVAAGSKPKADDYYGDPEGYVAAVSEWEQKRKAVPTVKPKQESALEIDPEVLESVEESTEMLRKALPSYDQDESALRQALIAKGRDPEIALAQLADLTYGEEIDFARTVVGLSKFPALLDKVLSAKSAGVLKRAIKEAESKVKVHQRKKIESTPEPTVRASGGVNAADAEIDRLRAKYAETGSVTDFKALVAARKKLRGN